MTDLQAVLFQVRDSMQTHAREALVRDNPDELRATALAIEWMEESISHLAKSLQGQLRAKAFGR